MDLEETNVAFPHTVYEINTVNLSKNQVLQSPCRLGALKGTIHPVGYLAVSCLAAQMQSKVVSRKDAALRGRSS